MGGALDSRSTKVSSRATFAISRTAGTASIYASVVDSDDGKKLLRVITQINKASVFFALTVSSREKEFMDKIAEDLKKKGYVGASPLVEKQ